MAAQSTPTEPDIDGDFTINDMVKLSKQYTRNADQVPVSLNIVGVPSLRERSEPYKVTKS